MINSTLPANLIKTKNKIRIEFSRDQLESMMNTCGLFRKDFFETLEQSEKDHQTGRVTKRQSLEELIED